MANDKKNTLLEEGTVRRFMKLAEIGPLSNSFLDGYHTLEEQEPPGMEEEDDKLDLELDLDAEEGEIDGVESEEEAFGPLPPVCENRGEPITQVPAANRVRRAHQRPLVHGLPHEVGRQDQAHFKELPDRHH